MTNQPITPYNFGKKLEEPKGPPPPDFDNVPENKALWDNLRREYKAYQEALRIYNIQKGEKPEPSRYSIGHKIDDPNVLLNFRREEYEEDLNIWYAGQKIYEGFKMTFDQLLKNTVIFMSKELTIIFNNGGLVVITAKKTSYCYESDHITHEQLQTICKWWGVELKTLFI